MDPCYEWKDFILYPNGPANKVEDPEERLDTSDCGPGIVVRQEDVIPAGDAFEAMGFSDIGDVGVWTTNYFCYLLRHSDTESMHRVLRHPSVKFLSDESQEKRKVTEDSSAAVTEHRTLKIFHEWRDFILYTHGPITRVKSLDHRLDISGGVRITKEDMELGDARYEALRERMYENGFIAVAEDTIPIYDTFEAMGISESGGVVIWTTNAVCTLLQIRGMEILRYLPRNPFYIRPTADS